MPLTRGNMPDLLKKKGKKKGKNKIKAKFKSVSTVRKGLKRR